MLCRDGIQNYKDQLNFQVVSGVKGNKKHFYKYIAAKKEIRELSGNQVMKNSEKLTEVISVFLN